MAAPNTQTMLDPYWGGLVSQLYNALTQDTEAAVADPNTLWQQLVQKGIAAQNGDETSRLFLRIQSRKYNIKVSPLTEGQKAVYASLGLALPTEPDMPEEGDTRTQPVPGTDKFRIEEYFVQRNPKGDVVGEGWRKSGTKLYSAEELGLEEGAGGISANVAAQLGMQGQQLAEQQRQFNTEFPEGVRRFGITSEETARTNRAQAIQMAINALPELLALAVSANRTHYPGFEPRGVFASALGPTAGVVPIERQYVDPWQAVQEQMKGQFNA